MHVSQLIDYRKKLFQSYVDHLYISDELKACIRDDVFIDQNPSAYLYYPYLFYGAFQTLPSGENEPLDKLCIAGYFYYRSLIENDTVLDQSSDIPMYLFPIASSICQEESIKLLSSLFPLEHSFWKTWNRRKAEYLYALRQEKALPESVSLQEYEKIADGKSAFGKVAIDACYFLCPDADPMLYAALVDSHFYFSTGFQLLDDIIDFKQDLSSPQINYAHLVLKEHLLQKGILFQDTDPAILHKYLYMEGIAESLGQLAIQYFDKALNSLNSLATRVPMWTRIIEGKRSEALALQLQVTAYKQTLYARLNLSSTPYEATDASLVQRLQDAQHFIGQHQQPDGSWQDIYNAIGLSNVWATSFVVLQLSELQNDFCTEIRQKACQFLQTHRQQGVWGYNTQWTADTDATTCALLALALNQIDISAELPLWLRWQHPDGRFSRYQTSEAFRQYTDLRVGPSEGWLQPHGCVSAMAFYLLCKVAPSAEATTRLYHTLVQNASPLWDSYWWTSPIYATSYVLQGLHLCQSTYNVQPCVKALLALQQTDGSFTNRFQQPSVFYTARAVSILCQTPAWYQEHTEAIEKAVHWLLKQQYQDGSFATSFILQTPAPDITDPRQVRNWKDAYTHTNSIAHDFMRLFTTATAINALDRYVASTRHEHPNPNHRAASFYRY